MATLSFFFFFGKERELGLNDELKTLQTFLSFFVFLRSLPLTVPSLAKCQPFHRIVLRVSFFSFLPPQLSRPILLDLAPPNKKKLFSPEV